MSAEAAPYYATGDATSDIQWLTMYYGNSGFHPNGVIFRRSQCMMADITNGASNTYLIGERYLSPDNYTNGVNQGDDQGYFIGYDYDTSRWVQLGTPTTTGYLPPMQDTPGYVSYNLFGSAHSGGLNMAFCDGAIQFISYQIDPETHRRLGNREDGNPVDPKKL